MKDSKKILKDIKLKILSLKYIGSRNKIILAKENKFNNVDIKFSKKFIKSKSNKNTDLLKEKIQHFLSTLEKKCKNFKSDIFIKNFKKTIFDIENLSDELKAGVGGSVKVNYINSFNLKHFYSTYHELLHLTSLKKGQEYLGPIYEWYTELLAQRYFGNDEIPSYVFGVKIMKAIETIFGQDYLEKLYFEGNFHLLWKKLFEKLGKRNQELIFFNFNIILELEQENDFLNRKDDIKKLLNNTYEILSSNYLTSVIEENKDSDRNNFNDIKDIWCSDIKFNYRGETLIFNTLNDSTFNDYFNKFYRI